MVAGDVLHAGVKAQRSRMWWACEPHQSRSFCRDWCSSFFTASYRA